MITATATATAITAMILCNNLNYLYSPRCMEPVAEFHQTIDGFEGTLTNGIPFTQKRITPYMMEFQMEDVHYLVFKDTIVYVD